MESGANQYPLRKKYEIEQYFKEHPKDWNRFLSASVVIKPTIEPNLAESFK